MTTLAPPICVNCQRLFAGWQCEAFPSGIPDEIIANEFDHRQPHEGDGGLLFEPVDSQAAEMAELLFNPPPEEDEEEPAAPPMPSGK
jgi:hypothetical protein